jgi:hypothetical protein
MEAQTIEEGDLIEIKVKPEFRACFSVHILGNEVSRVVFVDVNHIWAVPEKPFRGSINKVPLGMVEITILAKPGVKMKKGVEDIDILIGKLALKINKLVEKALICGSGFDGAMVREMVENTLSGVKDQVESLEARVERLEKEWFT